MNLVGLVLFMMGGGFIGIGVTHLLVYLTGNILPRELSYIVGFFGIWFGMGAYEICLNADYRKFVVQLQSGIESPFRQLESSWIESRWKKRFDRWTLRYHGWKNRLRYWIRQLVYSSFLVYLSSVFC